MHYRRSALTDGTYFFTVNLADRSSRLLTDNIQNLRAAVRVTRHTHPFDIVAMVVLPEHLHAVWTLPADDNDYPLRWSLIKSAFSRSLPEGEYISPSRVSKRERGSGNVAIGNIRYAMMPIWLDM